MRMVVKLPVNFLLASPTDGVTADFSASKILKLLKISLRFEASVLRRFLRPHFCFLGGAPSVIKCCIVLPH